MTDYGRLGTDYESIWNDMPLARKPKRSAFEQPVTVDVKRVAAMQHNRIIPDDQISDLPLVRLHIFRLSRVDIETLKQLRSGRPGHFVNAHGRRWVKIEGRDSAHRMSVHQGMSNHWGFPSQLL